MPADMTPEPRLTSKFGVAALPGLSANTVQAALDAVEIEFTWCARVVGALSGYRVTKATGADIVGFQMRLYNAIADLEKLYRRIKQEEKRLIREKARFKSHWFAKRMGHLAGYTKEIREGLRLGRSIGDGYAWFFYERDPELIEEHLKQQPQLLFPPDLGAEGERIFLENIRGVDGKLVLYHGITSMLRIGDFTLIDMSTLRVACLAELKTSRIDTQRINISLSMIAGAPDQFPTFTKLEAVAGAPTATPPMTSAMQARLERQKKVMEESIVRARDTKVGLTVEEELGFHYKQLEEVVKRSCAGGAFEYLQAGDSLVLAAWRLPLPISLGSRSSAKALKLLDEAAQDIPKWAMRILAPESRWNSLCYNSLGGEAAFTVRRGGLPFFAWPTDPDVLADIAFGRVVVFTLFNAGHLITRLEERGYKIEIDENGRLKRASKELDGRAIELENYDYFLSFVQWALMTEEAVLSMIDQTIAAMADMPVDQHPAKVEFLPRIRRDSVRDDLRGKQPKSL